MHAVPIGFVARPTPRRRKRRGVGSLPPVVVPLTLVSASYEVGTSVTLTFDRAVVVDGSDPSQVVVDDGGQTGQQWLGAGATLDGPATVVVSLVEGSATPAFATLLNATAATGFVAADDGGTWAGVTELELPWP